MEIEYVDDETIDAPAHIDENYYKPTAADQLAQAQLEIFRPTLETLPNMKQKNLRDQTLKLIKMDCKRSKK